MSFEITHVEFVITNEILNGCSQRVLAQTYALALKSSWPTDWEKVNRAIIKRWSVAGLERVKRLAHSGKY